MRSSIRFHYQLAQPPFLLRVDREIPGNGITAIYGGRGAGKSLLLRTMAGLEQPPDAFLEVNGEVWHDSEEGIFLPPQLRAVGYVPSGGALFPHLHVGENLRYPLRWGRGEEAEMRSRYDEVIDHLELTQLLHLMPSALTPAQQLRVAIGRALCRQPQLLLLDDPFAHLQPDAIAALTPLFQLLRDQQEFPVLLAASRLEQLYPLADYLLLLEKGMVVEGGECFSLLSRADIPLAAEADAGALIEGEVFEHDDEFFLTRIFFDGGELTLRRLRQEVGAMVRVRVHARDVSIANKYPSPSSILNILPAVVDTIVAQGVGVVMVRLLVGGVTPVLARISEKSTLRLGLREGKRVYLQIKAVSICGG
ncbi:MAG: ATP-binding cassette domain-containing protein [Gammaproteobacteria bacterium]|nr:ATP-binding cassette domain-containing protein [Gammaproteobacteria bacterium]